MIDEAPIASVTGAQDRQERGKGLAERLGLTYLAGKDFPEAQPVEIPFAVVFLRQYRFLPLRLDEGLLRVIMADPTDVDTVDAIRMYSGCEVEPVVGEEVEILEAVERLYGSGAATVRKIIEDLGEGEMEVLTGPAEEDEEHLRDMASEAPVIRLVNLLITKAADVGASDIHFEPFEDRLVVR